MIDVPWEDIFKLRFRLELMYLTLILSIRSNLTHSHGFQQLVLRSLFTEIIFFVCTNRINLLNLKQSSGSLVIVAKGFLKLPNMHILLKQKSPSLPRNLVLMTFGELQIVFSKKGKSAYFFYSMAKRCCLLHLIKQNCLLKTFLRTLILMTWVLLYLFSLLELI